MFKEFRSEASAILEKALKGHQIAVEPEFSIPIVERFGDLSSNVCFHLTSTFKKSPQEIAELLASEIKPGGLVRDVRTEKGYLNFYIDYTAFSKRLFERAGPDYGRGVKRVEKIVIEHTSANPDGPLHIGHLRNAVIGDTLARILRFVGYPVEVHYYLNDMGKQTAKVVWGRKRWNVGEGKHDHATAEVYIKASKIIEEEGLDEEVSKILGLYEKEDKETVWEFKAAVEFCLEGIKETLRRLGIRHDRFVWESAFVRDGSVARVIDRLSKTSLARDEEGALVLDLEEQGIEKELVIKRRDGTSLYIARDLAHHAWKMKQGAGINVWGADHKLVSKHLCAGLKLLGIQAPEFIIHEFITLPEGSMSTRKGVFISADQLLDETVKKALEEVRSRRPGIDLSKAGRIAEEVGVSAVRFNIERIAPEKSMVFRWEEALDFERQGAPFIQYAYARGRKILSKAPEVGNVPEIKKIEDAEKRLIRAVSRFPEVVEEAANSRKASIVANYAVELSNNFHGFYMSSRVLGSTEEKFRLALVHAFVLTMGNAMDLLGIRRLDEM